MARLHPTLSDIRTRVNLLYPSRSKATDGWIGDARHQTKISDHNPDEYGMVNALDITHDEEYGPDLDVMAENIRDMKHPLIKYVIWNKRGFSSYRKGWRKPWAWRKWSGHTNHMHISLYPRGDKVYEKSLLDVVPSPDAMGFRAPATRVREEEMIQAQLIVARSGDRDPDDKGMVVTVQRLLSYGSDTRLVLDGIYGPKTAAAVKAALENDGDAVSLSEFLWLSTVKSFAISN